MQNIDTTRLAAGLIRGDADAREEVERSFGVELPSHHFSVLRRLAAQTHDTEQAGLSVLLSLLHRFAHSKDDLLYERQASRRAFEHHLFVRWTHDGVSQLTVGVVRTYGASPATAWPELEPWSRSLEKNRERIASWARSSTVACVRLKARAVEAAPGADDEARLRSAITDTPDADEPRLVYADWLMERGDVRGELIRLQCALEATGEGGHEARSRVNAILTASWTNLAGPAAPYAELTSFKRGFVDRVTMTVPAFFKHGEALFSAEPIRRLVVDAPRFTERDLVRLGQAEALVRVRHLELAQLNPDAAPRRPLAALARSTRLTGLRGLSLDFCGESPADWGAFFGTLNAPALEQVRLHYNHGSAELYRALATNPSLARLRSIREYRFAELDGPDAEAKTIEAFTALARHRPSLKHLEVSQRAPIADAAVVPFFEGASVVRLEQLSVSGSSLSDVTALAIAESPNSSDLRVLHAHGAGFTLAGVEALLRSRHLTALAQLAIGSSDERSWPPPDVERLAAMLLALPSSSPLREVTLPRPGALPEDLERALRARFTISV